MGLVVCECSVVNVAAVATVATAVVVRPRVFVVVQAVVAACYTAAYTTECV